MKNKTKQRNDSIIRLRKIMGDISQAAFAKSIGVSLDLIKSVETGRNTLTPQLSHTIYMATGAEVLAGADKSPTYYGKPYERRHLDHWRSKMFPSSAARAWNELDGIIKPTMLLMWLAATRPAIGGKVRDRLPALLQNWTDWARGTIEFFELGPQIKALLNEFPIEDSKTLPWGMWRNVEKYIRNWSKARKSAQKELKQMHQTMQRSYGFKDDKNKPDEELLTLKVEMRCEFTVGCGFSPEMAKRFETLRR